MQIAYQISASVKSYNCFIPSFILHRYGKILCNVYGVANVANVSQSYFWFSQQTAEKNTPISLL